MDNVSPEGFQQGNFQSADVLSTAPPPPPEVKIRTMRSDLESMAKSGGGMPRFQNVKVAGLSIDREKEKKTGTVRNASDHANTGMVIGIVVLAAVILAVAGYFAYHFLLK